MAAIVNPLFTNNPQYGALVANSIGAEGLVNGIWNAILFARFPTAQLVWTINPEYGVTGGFPDLLVIRNDLNVNPARTAWTVIYEGKSSTGDTYPRILTQLVSYTASLRNGQFVYLVGARGRTCGFWKYTKGNSQAYQQMSSDGAGNVRIRDLSTVAEYDVVTQQRHIADILLYIINNPPPFP